jgi:hypothetical protein
MSRVASSSLQKVVQQDIANTRERRSSDKDLLPTQGYQYPASTFPLHFSPLPAGNCAMAPVHGAPRKTGGLSSEQPESRTEPFATAYSAPKYSSRHKNEAANSSLAAPPGALPEKDYPVFPYDKEQDRPAGYHCELKIVSS